MQSRLAYLQVLLIWAQLVAAGVVDVPSDQPQSFYKCILHFKKPIAEGKCDKHYRMLLTKDDADEAEAMPKRKRGPVGAVAPPIVDLDATGHAPCDGVAGDPLDDVAGDSGSDEVAAAPPPVVAAPGPLEDLPVDHVPAEICGALVKILPGHAAKGYHRRIQVKCNVEGHAGCNT